MFNITMTCNQTEWVERHFVWHSIRL